MEIYYVYDRLSMLLQCIRTMLIAVVQKSASTQNVSSTAQRLRTIFAS